MLLLPQTAAEAARLVAEEEAGTVRYAAAQGAKLASDAAGHAGTVASGPVDWMCAGKPVIAYAVLLAMMSAGWSCDDDIRPLIVATPQCPKLTMREVLTYRSGLNRRATDEYVHCTTEPDLARPPNWNPSIDAAYWTAGWEIIPGLIATLTGQDFETYVTRTVLRERFNATGVSLRREVPRYFGDPAWKRNPDVTRVFPADEVVSGLRGPLDALCNFYRGVCSEIAEHAEGPAELLLSSNQGPDFGKLGISTRRRWALGFPSFTKRIKDCVPDDAFGTNGGVLILEPDGPTWATVCLAGALPGYDSSFAVAMDGLLCQTKDPRYGRLVAALVNDLEDAAERDKF